MAPLDQVSFQATWVDLQLENFRGQIDAIKENMTQSVANAASTNASMVDVAIYAGSIVANITVSFPLGTDVEVLKFVLKKAF